MPLILIFIFSIGNNKNVLNYLLFLVFLPYFAYSIFFTVNKNTLYREEMRPLLSYLSKNVVNDEIIYLKRGAHQAFRFYTLNYDKPYNFDNEIIYEQNCPQNSEFCNLKKGKIWVICAQNSDNLPKNAHLLKRLNFRGNNLYYIVIE